MPSIRPGMGRVLSMLMVSIAATSTSLSAQAAPAVPAAIFNPITHEGYIEPPEPLRSLVDAPRNLNVSYTAGNLAPGSRRFFLRPLTENMPPLAQMGAPFYNLAGWQVDARGNRARNMTTRSLHGIELFDWERGRTVRVTLPARARAFGPTFSPDGNTLAFFALLDDATHIYLADPATGQSRPLTRTSVLATNVTSINWTADSRSIVTVLTPDGRGREPQPPLIATEPKVRVNENNRLRTRTLFSLLESPYEKTLLEYHITGQLAVIDVRTRGVRKIGEPAMIRSINPSPDGQYFRVTYLDKPFSYFQQVNSWGTHELLLDAQGNVKRELARRALRDGTQVDPDPDPTDPRDPTDPNDPDPADPPAPRAPQQRPTGPDMSRRALSWHPYGSGQIYLQLARTPADTTVLVDRLVHLPDPADTTKVQVVYESSNRINAVRFSENGRVLFVTEGAAASPRAATATGPAGQAAAATDTAGAAGAAGRSAAAATGTAEIAVFLDEGGAKYTIMTNRGSQAAQRGGAAATGAAPAAAAAAAATASTIGATGGPFVGKRGNRGNAVVMVSSDGAHVFATGRGRSQADSTQQRSYVEKIEIRTGTRSRIYESESPIESGIVPLDDDFRMAVVRRESSQTVGQSFIVDLRTKQARQVTQNRDLFGDVARAQTRTLFARRADGMPIRVRVTLPHDYVEGTKLPALFWFYPSEYDSIAAYTRGLPNSGNPPTVPAASAGSQNATPSPGSFPNYGPRTMRFVTAMGYALVEPDAPIVATPGRRPNDNYVRDLRENLQAVITMLDTLQLVDRNRLGIGGHSYGGFSTVNAMVHTTFFKAGIAGNGAYNRTLTPNGFQRESRDLWQGRETYLQMSPFLFADQLSGALLLYHSFEDQNVGTHPVNSERLFHALQGLGKTVSLYMYPYEDHGPAARETVLDQWGRWIAWLDKYVKGTESRVIVQ
jgi:dipeptidyl aminopeptidase/acylaminoacyl peptidase